MESQLTECTDLGNMDPQTTSDGASLICDECEHRDKPVWAQQEVRDLGTGLAGRRKETQEEGKKLAQMLKAPLTLSPHDGFLAIQACLHCMCTL